MEGKAEEKVTDAAVAGLDPDRSPDVFRPWLDPLGSAEAGGRAVDHELSNQEGVRGLPADRDFADVDILRTALRRNTRGESLDALVPGRCSLVPSRPQPLGVPLKWIPSS